MLTEEEMRNAEAPRPKSEEELTAYIKSLTDRDHDYGTCVYAMSMAATATFNYVASKLGATGFQASCADLDILRRTRNINGPFIFLKGEDMLFPQYDLPGKLSEAMSEWAEWVKDQAQAKIDEHGGEVQTHRFQDDDGEWHEYQSPHPNVWEHWQRLAGRPEVE